MHKIKRNVTIPGGSKEITKSEIARQLGISRSYVTMLTKGERLPSKRLQRKIEKFTGTSSLLDMFDGFTRKRSLVQDQYRPHSHQFT